MTEASNELLYWAKTSKMYLRGVYQGQWKSFELEENGASWKRGSGSKADRRKWTPRPQRWARHLTKRSISYSKPLLLKIAQLVLKQYRQ
jgi:hypothetical protein